MAKGVLMILKLALAFLLLTSDTTPKQAFNQRDIQPTLNLSAIRSISCDGYTGSGFLIGDDILLTAAHISGGTG